MVLPTILPLGLSSHQGCPTIVSLGLEQIHEQLQLQNILEDVGG